jgi:hypothetical protein
VTPGDIVRVTETVEIDGLEKRLVLIPQMILTVDAIRGGDVRLNYGWGFVWIPSRLVEKCG